MLIIMRRCWICQRITWFRFVRRIVTRAGIDTRYDLYTCTECDKLGCALPVGPSNN